MGRNAGGGQSEAAGPAAWPKVSRKKGLARRELLGDHLFTIAGVLSIPEAQAFIDAAERTGFAHQGSRGAAYGEAYRDNHRIQFEDAALAAQLWEAGGLRPLFEGVEVDGGRAVGLNPNIRIYRYTPKQRFGKHIDDSVDLGPGETTRYTLLIYLSGAPDPSAGGGASSGGGGTAANGGKAAATDAAGGSRGKRGAAAAAAAPICASAVQPLQGGETVFYGDRGRVLAAVAPRPGLALLHLHGADDCLEHEGAAVAAGTKYVLRSDVVFSAR